VVVIQESHLAIHTWPEYGYASVDLFTCGETVNPWVSYNYLKEAFEAAHGSAVELRRGEMALLTHKDFDINQMRDEKSAGDGTPMRTKDVWFTERNDNIALSLKHDGKLYEEESEFQKVEVYKTFAYGNMLTLDGMVMTTEKDEHGYHEMIAHVPMFTRKDTRRVLVIGGGDGGELAALRHALSASVSRSSPQPGRNEGPACSSDFLCNGFVARVSGSARQHSLELRERPPDLNALFPEAQISDRALVEAAALLEYRDRLPNLPFKLVIPEQHDVIGQVAQVDRR
jgi:hypothetical protein